MAEPTRRLRELLVNMPDGRLHDMLNRSRQFIVGVAHTRVERGIDGRATLVIPDDKGDTRATIDVTSTFIAGELVRTVAYEQLQRGRARLAAVFSELDGEWLPLRVPRRSKVSVTPEQFAKLADSPHLPMQD